MKRLTIIAALLATQANAADYKAIQVYSEVNGAALAVAVNCKGAQLTAGFADEMAQAIGLNKQDRDAADAAAITIYLSATEKAEQGGAAWCAKVMPALANPIEPGMKAPITIGGTK